MKRMKQLPSMHRHKADISVRETVKILIKLLLVPCIGLQLLNPVSSQSAHGNKPSSRLRCQMYLPSCWSSPTFVQ